jgi:hypothetical protein
VYIQYNNTSFDIIINVLSPEFFIIREFSLFIRYIALSVLFNIVVISEIVNFGLFYLWLRQCSDFCIYLPTALNILCSAETLVIQNEL